VTTVASGTTRRTRILVALIAVFSPLVLLAFNRDWFITPDGFRDPWHYVGFFHQYWNPDFGSGAYKLARLPWILSGVLAWSLLPPLPAAYALHAVYLCATTLAAFVGVQRLFGQPGLAAVVALCLGFYTHAHGSGGWDYHNTAAGAFYFASFAALASRDAAAGRGRSLAVAGALLALTVHSNITLVNFLPVLVFVHLRIAERAGWQFSIRGLAVRVAWGLIGALVVTAALALVHWTAGRGVLFFQDLVRVVVRFVGDSGNQEAYRLEPGWYHTATHLSLPAAVFLAGMAALAWTWRAPGADARLARTLVGQFLCMAAVWTGWQAAGQTALDWNYFAYALVPSCFIAVAGLLKLAWRDQYERYALAIACGTAALLALTLSGAAEQLVQPVASRFAGVMTAVAALVFLASLAAAFLRPAAVALPAFVIVFALANRIAAPAAPSEYAFSDPCKTRPEIYEAIVDASLWLRSIDPTSSQVRTWFANGERVAIGPAGCSVMVRDIGQSATDMALMETLFEAGEAGEPGEAGEFPIDAVQALSNGEAVFAVMTASLHAGTAWDARLREVGLTRREVARHQIPLRDSALTVEAWIAEQAPPDGLVFGEPLLTIDRQSEDGAQPDASGVLAPRERVSHPPTVIPSSAGGTWARIRIETPGGISWCRVALQDEAGGTLISTLCTSGTRYVLLPASTTSIAVAFENPTNRPAPLPARIDVALAGAGN
jgi:hypothetical protein